VFDHQDLVTMADHADAPVINLLSDLEHPCQAIADLQTVAEHRPLDGATIAFIGDGTLGEGALYETLNIASKWELPLLVVLENNLYAQSTNQEETLAGGILDRPRAFGIESAQVPLWDTVELMKRSHAAVEHVRSTRKPFFLQVDTYRLMAHSKGDDDRDPAEVESYRKRDPLTLYIESNPVDAARLQERAAEQVDAAVARADATAYTQAGSNDGDAQPDAEVSWKAVTAPVAERVVSRIHDALQLNMLRNEKIVLIGEDIEGPYGGAFKVTRNLSQEFPGRVRNTPISEAAIVGLGNGLALAGHLPVCEIMFGDFITLAFDQLINHASKFRYMYNDQVNVPLVVRTPMGGKRGYGATHSQSLEKHLLGIPDLQVLALNHRFDPFELYDNLLSNVKQPTLVVENKLLYGMKINGKLPEGFVLERSAETFPTMRITTGQTPDLTLFCYGGMLPDAERAADQLFEEHEMIVEILCPTRLYPLNAAPLEASLAGSGRLLMVEEGVGFAGFGAEVLAQLTERSNVNFRARRLAAPAHPIPSCGPLEKELLPGVRQIVDAAVELVGNG